MDLMKVGKSLGLGSIGIWIDSSAVRVEATDSVTCEIRHNGDLVSAIRTSYFGWKTKNDTIDVVSDLSIHAGTRLTKHELNTTHETQLCTGIVKDKLARVFKSEGNKDSWGYIATYGKQSLNGDNLGLVVLFSPSYFTSFREDAGSHVVNLKTVDNKVDYSFGAAWALETNGITNEADFIKWVERSARELANPVIVHVK
jgi:hypothetical protein